MSAVQFMRGKAEPAGNLKTTPQQSVTNQGSDVVIQPVNPDTVYVPDYDPELAYGYPIGLWPGFYPWWGAEDPYLSFGIGYGMSPFLGTDGAGKAKACMQSPKLRRRLPN
jgi:hypothetical protein